MLITLGDIEIFRRLWHRISVVLLDMTMPDTASVAMERFGTRDLAGFVQKPYTAAAVAEKLYHVRKADTAQSPGK